MGGDGTKWILQGCLNQVPFDGQLLEQLWIDNMAIRFAAMGVPHSLFNRVSKEIGWGGVTLQVQWNPGKVGKFAVIRLWINRPLVSSSETINADDRLGLGRRSGY